MNRKIRYAVVGLGHIAQSAVLPAFEHAENSELAALVTGNSEKDRELSERYRVRAYAYDDLENAVAAQHLVCRLLLEKKNHLRRPGPGQPGPGWRCAEGPRMVRA